MKKPLQVLLAIVLMVNAAIPCSASTLTSESNSNSSEVGLTITADDLAVSSTTADVLHEIYLHDFELFRFICYSFLSDESLIYSQAKMVFPEFQTFEQYEDAGRALLTEYIKADISVDEKLSDFEQYKAYILEFLLSQPIYRNKLTESEKNILMEAKEEKDCIRSQYISDGYREKFLYGFDFSAQ